MAKKDETVGVKRIETAVELSEIVRKNAIAEIKRQYPYVKKEDISKMYLGWIACDKFLAR